MEIKYRSLNQDDAGRVARHRTAMFCDAGRRDPEHLREMEGHFETWVRPKINEGSYFGTFAIDGKTVVGGIGAMILDWAPHPLHPTSAHRGYILNLYVQTAYRKRGIAAQLMSHVESRFKDRGVTYAFLHATALARPIYETKGWMQTAELGKQYSLDAES